MTAPSLLLHPVRLRVVQVMLGRGDLTTADLRAAMPDVPPATLYRHIGALLEGDVVEVVGERKVRGAVERTYRLLVEAAQIDGDEAAVMTVDQHRQGFLTFVAGLLGDFDRYLDRGDVDLQRDQVAYSQAALNLSDDEMQALLHELAEVIVPRLSLPAGPGRTRRLLSSIVMPDAVSLPEQ